MDDIVKKENKKALPKFLICILLCGLGGGVAGFFSGVAAGVGLGEVVRLQLEQLLYLIAPWGIPVSSAVLLGAGWWIYRSAKRLYARLDEDEELADVIDTKLNWVMLLSTLALLCDLFFLAAGMLYADTLWNVALVIVSFVLLTLLQQRVVDLTRRMNPEKRGSIYDTRFQKKWLDSCDEAERAQIGQASYKAYMSATKACIGLWLVLVILSISFDFGLLPVLVVVIVLGVLQVSYILECIRLSRRKG